MNKHQYRAIALAVLAIFGIITSIIVWGRSLEKLPLATFPESMVSLTKEVIERVTEQLMTVQEVTVEEVTVEQLGTHFVKHTTSTSIRASVITDAVVSDTHVSVPETEPEVVHESAPVVPVEPSELDRWQLMRAWHIAIPSLGVRAPVLLPSMQYWSSQAWDLLEEQMQVGLNHGTVAYPHSVSPGQQGSLIIAGHSSPPTSEAMESVYGSVFSALPDIAIGEEITVNTAGETVTYKVEDKYVVSPKETTILQQQHDESILKLITCYPVGTTRDRMIIVAKKI